MILTEFLYKTSSQKIEAKCYNEIPSNSISWFLYLLLYAPNNLFDNAANLVLSSRMLLGDSRESTKM